MNDITKQPQWVQREVVRLQRALDEANAALASGPGDSNTFANPYSSAPRPLGTDPTIKFITADGSEFRVRIDGNELDVSGMVGMGERLVIQPRASNAFTVSAAPRVR